MSIVVVELDGENVIVWQGFPSYRSAEKYIKEQQNPENFTLGKLKRLRETPAWD